MAVAPLLRPDGSLTHCPKEKAVLFDNVFYGKQSNDSLSMAQSCFPEAELTFAFRSGEVKKLLLNLILMVVLDLMAVFLCSLLKLPII